MGRRGKNGSTCRGARDDGRARARAHKGRGPRHDADDDARFVAQLARVGLAVASVVGDGNCLFRAVAHQLVGDDSVHAGVRAVCVRHLAATADDFAPFLLEEEGYSTMEEYVAAMACDGEWGGNIELILLARVFRVDIVVHQLGGPPWVVEGAAGHAQPDSDPDARSAATLALSYHNGDHYQSLVLRGLAAATGPQPLLWDAGADAFLPAGPRAAALRAELATAGFRPPTAAVAPRGGRPATAPGEREPDHDADDDAGGDGGNGNDDAQTAMETTDGGAAAAGPRVAAERAGPPPQAAESPALQPRRNGPCPCGSGAVFRRCCGGARAAMRGAARGRVAGAAASGGGVGGDSDGGDLVAGVAAIRI